MNWSFGLRLTQNTFGSSRSFSNIIDPAFVGMAAMCVNIARPGPAFDTANGALLLLALS